MNPIMKSLIACLEVLVNKVTNGDIVYILGDIAMRGKNEELITFVSTLKGQKEFLLWILVK